jgi:hypothetical protein
MVSDGDGWLVGPIRGPRAFDDAPLMVCTVGKTLRGQKYPYGYGCFTIKQ